jgi:hypothetical protein
MTSFLDHVHEGAEIVLDFQTKIKAMMKIILPVVNIMKSAKICEPGLKKDPGHKASSTELTTKCSAFLEYKYS